MLELQQAGMSPKALETRPSLDSRQAFYFRAFDRCSRARQWRDGVPGAVPIAEVLAYCAMFAIDDQDLREQVLDHVQDLDDVYRSHVAAKIAKSSEPVVAEETPAP